ncbi:MAG: hypothetical protein HZB25_01235 [Candidatus Eisenbacteria bacterium]|nr:hypothetical protein [Candidatus Eisenbacteria bacterium]
MTTTETPVPGSGPAPAEEPAPQIVGGNSLARMLSVLWSPGKAMASVAARPALLVPFLVVVLFQGLVTAAIYKPVVIPFQLSQMAERSAEMSPEQRAQMDKYMASPVAITMGVVGSAVSAAVVPLVWAALMYFVFTLLLSGRADFKAVLSVCLHASVVQIPHTLVWMPLAIAKQDPRVFFGPSALMDMPDPPTFLYRLLEKVDMFSLWSWALLAVGLALVYRKPSRQVLVWVSVVFVAGSVAMAALQGVMGRFGGGM